MITVEIQPQLEKDFKEIVQKFYNGDECAAINEAVKLFVEREKRKNMTWEKRFDAALETVRERVDARGGISDEEIEQAVQRVRQRKRAKGEVCY
jgi:Arc/MetJ-type ribon-helix-helix transcriptional regulator